MSHAPLALVLAVAAAGAVQAGTVEVSYANPERFADIGNTPWEEQEHLQTLTRHLQALGQRHLPQQQSLKVELLDVDLAGYIRPSRRTGQDLRLLRGLADVPHITLRYSLQSNGRVLRSGEETVSDLGYLSRLPDRYANESLAHEKRMLDRWFRDRFAAGSDAR